MFMPMLPPIAKPLRSVSVYSSVVASGNANSIAMPSGVIAGDVAVMFDQWYGVFGAAGGSTPPGWQSVAIGSYVFSNNGNDVQLKGCIWIKILAGNEDGQAIGGFTTSWKSLVVFRASEPVTSITLASNVTDHGNEASADKTIALAGLTVPYLALACVTSDDTVTDENFLMTPARDAIFKAYGTRRSMIRMENVTPQNVVVSQPPMHRWDREVAGVQLNFD